MHIKIQMGCYFTMQIVTQQSMIRQKLQKDVLLKHSENHKVKLHRSDGHASAAISTVASIGTFPFRSPICLLNFCSIFFNWLIVTVPKSMFLTYSKSEHYCDSQMGCLCSKQHYWDFRKTHIWTCHNNQQILLAAIYRFENVIISGFHYVISIIFTAKFVMSHDIRAICAI